MTSQATSFAIALLLLSMVIVLVAPYPTHSDVWPPQFSRVIPEHYTNECRTREDVETLCQTCAKQTRSNIVYPMCCEGREDARSWCEKYMGYGLQHDS